MIPHPYEIGILCDDAPKIQPVVSIQTLRSPGGTDLGLRKKCFARNGAGCGLVFKAREAVHIEIFAAFRNTEDEAGDKPALIKHFFRGP